MLSEKSRTCVPLLALATKPSWRLGVGPYFIFMILVISINPAAIHGATLGRTVGQTLDDNHIRPWQVNTNVCPPSLCGTPSPAVQQEGEDGAQYSPQAVTAPAPFSFFEGDIVLDEPTIARMRSGEGAQRSRRAIIRPISRLWKFGVVPYVLDDSLSEQAKHYTRSAFRHYERKTCLRFEKKTKDDVNYLHYLAEPGCWSYVGMKGGAQYLSIGYGCVYFGTIVHETGHALGFWHEQARSDRDEYIRIVTKNISPSAMDQFGIRSDSESTSRGFPYDYDSIMHYGDDYFSRNGEVTIKVRGIGKKLKPKLGQRKHLSELDIAQLNSMYYCNTKEMERSGCGEGWSRYKTGCYKYVKNPELHFRGAHDYCADLDSRLVHINSQDEDEYLKDFLITHYPNDHMWRTGGRRRNSVFGWFRSSSKQLEMGYTAWVEGHPGRYSALVLARPTPDAQTFEWNGVWMGSEEQLPSFGYPFICEKSANITCVNRRTRGRDYRGEMSYTSQGVTCQRWTSPYPHNHTLITGDPLRDDNYNGLLEDHNFCRNPNGMRKRPWCFTTLKDTKWQYCDMKLC